MTTRLVVIGGGAIGLSIAWHCARGGMQVTVVDRSKLGGEASWAGVGLLPYFNPQTARHPMEQLAAASHQLHHDWAIELQRITGVDYELEVCGAIYLARSRGEAASLIGLRQKWLDERIEFEQLDDDQLVQREPGLTSWAQDQSSVVALRSIHDAQLRSPRFLRALTTACRVAGVRLIENAVAFEWESAGEQIAAIHTAGGERIAGDHFCVAAGAWSGELLQSIGIHLEFVPVRGQIVRYQLTDRPLQSCLYEGGNYLVPRRDGTLLVGSTMEQVGFDQGVTAEAVASLRQFAESILPALRGVEPVQAWSGLRPASFDGFPVIGRANQFANLMVAAGHFRAGLHLAPITAEAIHRLLLDKDFEIDLRPFRVERALRKRIETDAPIIA